eukprot:5668940-Amphidinium_carterae.1
MEVFEYNKNKYDCSGIRKGLSSDYATQLCCQTVKVETSKFRVHVEASGPTMSSVIANFMRSTMLSAGEPEPVRTSLLVCAIVHCIAAMPLRLHLCWEAGSSVTADTTAHRDALI